MLEQRTEPRQRSVMCRAGCGTEIIIHDGCSEDDNICDECLEREKWEEENKC